MHFQSKDIQYFISYNVWLCSVLSGCEIIQLTIANTIENESKNRVLLIEKEFQYTVEVFSAQLFGMNNILKIIVLWQNPFNVFFQKSHKK